MLIIVQTDNFNQISPTILLQKKVKLTNSLLGKLSKPFLPILLASNQTLFEKISISPTTPPFQLTGNHTTTINKAICQLAFRQITGMDTIKLHWKCGEPLMKRAEKQCLRGKKPTRSIILSWWNGGGALRRRITTNYALNKYFQTNCDIFAYGEALASTTRGFLYLGTTRFCILPVFPVVIVEIVGRKSSIIDVCLTNCISDVINFQVLPTVLGISAQTCHKIIKLKLDFDEKQTISSADTPMIKRFRLCSKLFIF